jgi:hypothetical protein
VSFVFCLSLPSSFTETNAATSKSGIEDYKLNEGGASMMREKHRNFSHTTSFLKGKAVCAVLVNKDKL